MTARVWHGCQETSVLRLACTPGPASHRSSGSRVPSGCPGFLPVAVTNTLTKISRGRWVGELIIEILGHSLLLREVKAGACRPARLLALTHSIPCDQGFTLPSQCTCGAAPCWAGSRPYTSLLKWLPGNRLPRTGLSSLCQSRQDHPRMPQPDPGTGPPQSLFPDNSRLCQIDS